MLLDVTVDILNTPFGHRMLDYVIKNRSHFTNTNFRFL